MQKMTRRGFLDTAVAALGASAVASFGCGALEVVSVDNPLASYPDRDWEKLYRDQYRYDRTFTWVCAPNDTHMCRMRAFVRNGVVVRSEQNYDHQDYTDLLRKQGDTCLEPPGLPQGFHDAEAGIRPLPAERPRHTQGLERLGRCRGFHRFPTLRSCGASTNSMTAEATPLSG